MTDLAPNNLFDFDQHQGSSEGGLIGVDEVGRGPLAGPVVSAAVLIVSPHKISYLNDSKKISPKKRHKIFYEILNASIVNVAFSTEKEIDEMNILRASLLAMKRAVLGLPITPKKILIDGTFKIDLPILQETIIGGDKKSASIAAASIIAKVVRDAWMTKLDQKYEGYGFSKHKGYGTKVHLEKLKEKGPVDIHRKSFAPVKNILENSQ